MTMATSKRARVQERPVCWSRKCVCLPVLSSRQREARHRIFGAVEFLNDSDSGDRVRPLEVDQMGRCPDSCRLKIQDGSRARRRSSRRLGLRPSQIYRNGATGPTVPLERRLLCSQSHAACTPGAPGSQRSPGGTEPGSSSAPGSLWPR